jgi:hypothetical protein
VSDRDSWATPAWLTELLPLVDLDPCTNEQSTVKARKTYSACRGEDGLVLPWIGSTYVNPPFSSILPWAEKLAAESYNVSAAAFLVNADSSTRWWSRLTDSLHCALMFHRRIQFVPPPGIRPSTNNKPQALLMDEAFLDLCSPELLSLGTLWRSRRAA